MDRRDVVAIFEEKVSKAKDLYGQKNYVEALKLFCEIKKEDQQLFESTCKFHYMWCIYRQHINKRDAFEPENIQRTREEVKYILSNQTKDDLIYIWTVMKVIDHMKRQQNFDAANINKWLDKISPDKLSDKTTTYEKENGDQIVYISQKEKWYALKSKACMKLELYDECVSVSEEALTELKEFNKNNDIWFKRRIALSKSKLGNYKEALDILGRVTARKKDWFIFSDIGDVYKAMGNEEKALEHYFKAFTKPGKDEFKVNLFSDMSDLLYGIGEKEDADLLNAYAVKLKISEEWKLKDFQKQYYDEHKEEIDDISLAKLKKEIKLLEEKYAWKGKEKFFGKITKILPNGKAGFINTEKDSYYFKRNSFVGNANKLKEGVKVSFYVEIGYDKKKEQESLVAVNIHVEA